MKNLILIFASLVASVSVAQNWNQINVPTTKNLNDINFVNSNVGYIVGDDSLIMKTTDGGQNWIVLPPTNINFWSNSDDIAQVKFLTEDIGYITSRYSGTYRTLDGGQSWSMVAVEGNLCYSHSVYPFDSSNVLIAGAGCFQSALINRYENGSSTEMTVNYESFNSNEAAVDMDFRDANIGLAATRGKYMLRTTDAGSTWDTISTNLEESQYLTSVLWYDDTLVFAGYEGNGAGFGVLVSDDGGLTWYQDINSATFLYPDYTALGQSNSGSLYVAAHPNSSTEGMIYTRSDDGQWVIEQVSKPIYGIDSYGDDITFIVGDSGYVAVNQDLSILEITDLEGDQNIRIFPNPAINSISFSCDYCNLTEKKVVLNMRGESVMEIIGHENIDISVLPSGLYFIHFEDSGRTLKFVKE